MFLVDCASCQITSKTSPVFGRRAPKSGRRQEVQEVVDVDVLLEQRKQQRQQLFSTNNTAVSDVDDTVYREQWSIRIRNLVNRHYDELDDFVGRLLYQMDEKGRAMIEHVIEELEDEQLCLNVREIFERVLMDIDAGEIAKDVLNHGHHNILVFGSPEMVERIEMLGDWEGWEFDYRK